ncbi:hypothetical protein GCM10017576_02040 [Microbacterium barkeri]|uniref:Membrane protein (TIGR02234 family) n=1 Tax=Microbacterium barkeri TaxID=33917 RepID=A0A9W6H076_9MICO|nr:Trp biosynthesis-associated membrane protein [Microbacterium barkeri]MDR6875957.1 putative membrane protein (TIGR02234 family) [Microbacterium barkeri]GLJ60075.1 hypothetical protein GCM10017576_02040 [Microbacterium barkeri]
MTDGRMGAAPGEGALAGRGRMIAVLAALSGAALALIGSTQTWLTASVAGATLPVAGSEAVSVLQPLSLAALALSLVLAIVGPVVRYVLAALAVAVGGGIAWLSAALVAAPRATAASAVVTEHTGIAGESAIEDLVQGMALTPWPAVTIVAGALIALAGLWTLGTAHAWRRAGRRYEKRSGRTAAADDAPLDAIDSWDDLSRGDDPTR